MNEASLPVLYRISLSIGASFDIDSMLEAALVSFSRELGLSACGVLFYKVDGDGSLFFETKASFPEGKDLSHHYESAMRFLLSGEREPDIRSFESRLPLALADRRGIHIYLYNLPYVGVLLLEKEGPPFGKELMLDLVPLSERLALACTGCIRSMELSMVTDGTQAINRELAQSEKDLVENIRKMGETQEELRSGRNYFALLLQSLGDGVIAADRSGGVRLVNVKALEYLDYMPEPGEEVRLDRLMMKANPQADMGLLFSGTDEDGVFPEELSVIDRQGNARYLRVIINRLDILLPGEGGIIFLIQDITKLKELDRLKNEFISNLSHEMRTPMNAILGISKVLSTKDAANLTERQAQGLFLIHDSGSRLLTLINDMLDLSKIEAGRMSIIPEPFPLEELLSNIRNFVAPLASQSVLFTLDRSPGMPKYIVADENRIRQVLVNVLGNSFKFTAEGSVALRVSADGRMLTFSVADTGIGIPEKEIPFIFDRFRQVDGSASRSHQGTGIGLALTKELVGLMGGSISVKSGDGGTVMDVSIPYERADAISLSGGSDGKEGVPSRVSRIRVLVVDDDPAGRETLSFLLSGSYDLVFASDGDDAVRMFARSRPALVLMDIMMPGSDGFAALGQIRALPGGADAPVIAVTARAMKGDRERILGAGFDGYVSKPVDVDILTCEIEASIIRHGGSDDQAER